jgi:hypothetical protein
LVGVAVKVTLVPAQVGLLPDVIEIETVGVSRGLTVTVEVAVFVQPFTSVPVTVYVVFTVGLTEIKLVVVAPVDHEYVEAPFAIIFAVAPSQIVGEFTIIVGNGLTVTVV